MSRSRRQRGRRGYPVCEGCTACSWFPKRLQREGKRTDKVLAQEAAIDAAEFERGMERARAIMRRDADLLSALAKGSP